MKSKRTLFVGPFAPPYNGDGVKNIYLRDGFSRAGYDSIFWFDTITRKGLVLVNYLKLLWQMMRTRQILFSLNRNGRLYLIPIFWIFSLFSRKRAVLYVIGGSFDIQLTDYMSPFRRKLFVGILNKLDGIFAESTALKKGLEGVGLRNVELVYNPRHDDGSRWSLSESARNKCVFVSRVTDTKGILIFIQAIQELNRQGKSLSLDIYGPMDKECEKEIRDAELASDERIAYKGVLEPMAVQAVLSRYHFLALPTFHPGEGLPGILVESGLAGIPIIITRFNAFPEYFTHEESALFVRPHSVEELKDAILRLVEDDNLAQNLSNGIQKVTVPFRVEKVIERSLELLKQYNWEL